MSQNCASGVTNFVDRNYIPQPTLYLSTLSYTHEPSATATHHNKHLDLLYIPASANGKTFSAIPIISLHWNDTTTTTGRSSSSNHRQQKTTSETTVVFRSCPSNGLLASWDGSALSKISDEQSHLSKDKRMIATSPIILTQGLLKETATPCAISSFLSNVLKWPVSSFSASFSNFPDLSNSIKSTSRGPRDPS